MKQLRWNSLVVAGLISMCGSSWAADSSHASVVGLWNGTLQTAAGGLALELTVKQNDKGALVASLESVDQAAGQAIPIAHIQVEGDQLELDIDALKATYEGRFDSDKVACVGSWKQGANLPLTWTRGPAPTLPTFKEADGTWRGTLTRSGKVLRLVLRVTTSAHGTRAELDSPDMGLTDLEVADLALKGHHVHLRVPSANVVYEGDLGKGGTSLSGTWHRDGMPDATVEFVRDATSAPVPVERPQTPHPPFSYQVEDVQFPNPRASLSLAGTLTIPRGPGPFPAAVLITGSGPQDRDESIYGHKPFAVLADYLTRHGVAVLRVDDRGVGKSTGTFANATSVDFASDVRAAVTFLESRADINNKAIGLVGHSEGGLIGPLAAVGNSSVAYLVLLAGPATGLGELLISQRRMSGVMAGQSPAAMAATETSLALLYDAAAKASSGAEARTKVSALLTPQVLRQLGVDASKKAVMLDQFTSDWIRGILHYDAIATLGAIKVPILALNGSLDHQVPPGINLREIRRATKRNPDATTRELAGLNHMFQTAESGSVSEYLEISETFAPIALQVISEWINARFNLGSVLRHTHD